MAINFKMINEINSDPSSTWKAGVNRNLAGKTVAEMKRLLGFAKKEGQVRYSEEQMTTIKHYNEAKASAVKSVGVEEASKQFKTLGLPTNFDSRQQWGKCIHPIRNQEQCGSCWAFSASESLSDRFCIASNGKVDVILSPQDMVSCDYNDMGCDGGNLDNAWWWMKNKGIVPDSCMPYVSGGGNVPACPSNCNGTNIPISSQLYYAKSFSHISPWMFWERVADIQQEIYTNGPVQGGFSVYQDFMNYKSGVYSHKTGSFLGGHAIKIIGWGVEGGVDYWLVANSWSTDWGIDGTFKILRGHNECGIEDDVYAGPADLSRVPK
ncbi:cathepsin B [Naegleria gruberi]|uniref:Cathepsin B n=1 Tax=Naegleria gruberi TaxID=5762 RepID=D2VEH5_NAEGR|nr:cathepsin B [Naegleria gruberi]EFC44879.1 cathepsin B [Naegleria gruberi]|eukprot:XP_002677623.1 cathepsin B [Naegleria gruberi]